MPCHTWPARQEGRKERLAGLPLALMLGGHGSPRWTLTTAYKAHGVGAMWERRGTGGSGRPERRSGRAHHRARCAPPPRRNGGRTAPGPRPPEAPAARRAPWPARHDRWPMRQRETAPSWPRPSRSRRHRPPPRHPSSRPAAAVAQAHHGDTPARQRTAHRTTDDADTARDPAATVPACPADTRRWTAPPGGLFLYDL